jgi:hypothetical protein
VPTVPPDVDALVLRCMQKRPADRYASMRELADACETVLARVSAVDLAARSGAGVLPTVAADTVPPTPARRRALWIAGMALAVVGGIGIAFAVAGRTPHLAAPASATPAVTPPTPTPTPPAPTPAPPTPPVESAAPTAAVTTPATDPQPMTVVPTAPPTPATTPATTSSTTTPPPKHTATPTKPRPHAPKTTKGSDSEDLYGDR